MMQTIGLCTQNDSFVYSKPYVCDFQVNSFVSYEAMASNLMADYFHLLMDYIKIGAQLCVSCAPIAFKIYFYFTSSKSAS